MPRPRLRPADPRLTGHRLAFVIVATLLLFTAALLPFAVNDVLDTILTPPSARIYRVLTPTDPLPEQVRLHVTVTAIDEDTRSATVRVSGHLVCADACPVRYQVLLVSTRPGSPDAEGLPPSVAIAFPAQVKEVTQTLTVPLQGDPIRYPFDRYEMGAGIVLQRLAPDGSVQSVPANEAARRLFLTYQAELPRVEPSGPRKLNPESIVTAGASYPFVTVDQIIFERPLYLRVLTVLLVLLVAAAAAFAVFMRPLNELVINVGALVVGIWGVRSILVGTTALAGSSAVDLSLSVIILFLLAAITVRGLMFLGQRSRFDQAFRGRAGHHPSSRAGTADESGESVAAGATRE